MPTSRDCLISSLESLRGAAGRRGLDPLLSQLLVFSLDRGLSTVVPLLVRDRGDADATRISDDVPEACASVFEAMREYLGIFVWAYMPSGVQATGAGLEHPNEHERTARPRKDPEGPSVHISVSPRTGGEHKGSWNVTERAIDTGASIIKCVAIRSFGLRMHSMHSVYAVFPLSSPWMARTAGGLLG